MFSDYNYLQLVNNLDFFLINNNAGSTTINEIEEFMKINLRLIINQSKDEKIAEDLKTKLLELCDRINLNFESPSSRNLAVEIMDIAQGIFSKEKKDYTHELPLELRAKIYSELIDSRADNIREKLGPVSLISKSEYEVAENIKIEEINNGNLNFKTLGLKTFQDAIEFIKKNRNLHRVDLSNFKNLTDHNLKELQGCTWIKQLIFSCEYITNEGLEFLKPMQLVSIKCIDCQFLTDNVFEYLKEMKLQSVSFNDCPLLTDKAFEYLRDMKLQSVSFDACPLLTDKAFEYLKDMKLQSVKFTNCSLLTDKAFEYLKDMNLQSINFIFCPLLTDKAFEYLKDMQLQSVNFSYCPLLTDKAFEYLKGMPLQEIAFNGCEKLTDKALKYFNEMPVQIVWLKDCSISYEALDKLRDSRPGQISVNYRITLKKGLTFFGLRFNPDSPIDNPYALKF